MSGHHCGEKKWCKREGGCVCPCEGCGLARFNEESEANRMRPILEEQERALKDAVVEAAMAEYELFHGDLTEADSIDVSDEEQAERVDRAVLATEAACAALAEFRSRAKEQG